MEDSQLHQNLSRPYISCRSLSIEEIVERMQIARSRRDLAPKRVKRDTKAKNPARIPKSKAMKKKAEMMDKLKELIASGIDLEVAMKEVGI